MTKGWCFCLSQISIFCFFLLVISCGRHGEEDPGVSWGDRDKLIRGTWNLEGYTFDETSTYQRTTNINFVSCDTAGQSGTKVQNIFRQDNYTDTILNSTVVDNNPNDNESFAYEIGLIYRLRINKKGTYDCIGKYAFFDTGRAAVVEGEFSSEGNTWYWERSHKERWALTLSNFPVIDSESIETDGSPVRSVASQTFNVLRLAPKEMWLDFSAKEKESYTQEFDPFQVGPQTNCISKVQYRKDVDRNAEYRFKEYNGDWEIE